MKEIFIILTYTGTVLSRIIKLYTKAEFSHVSIAFDKNLQKMYSFGRLNPYNPFWGGFVHEYINKGTFKRFKNTKTKIYSIRVSDEQYERMKMIIDYIEIRKKWYKFNFLGLIGAGFNMKIHSKNSFYCAEFVKYVLNSSGVYNNLPEIIKPEDFKKIDNQNLIYEGILKNYQMSIC